MLAWKVQTSSGKAGVLLPLISRSSLLVAVVLLARWRRFVLHAGHRRGLFPDRGSGVFVFRLTLTRAITRSVDDLYRGTLQVAGGDFSRQIPRAANIS